MKQSTFSPHRWLTAAALLLGCALAAKAQVVTPIQTPGRTISSTQFGTPPAAPNATGRVEVFATSAMYVANAERATVYRADGRKQLLNEINGNGLPPNPQQATALARQRMQAMGPEFNRRVLASLQAVEKVMVYGVQRVPAVVVDGRRVVYGVTDVAQAVEIVRRGGGQPISARFSPGRRNPTPNGSVR